jgi:pimeloyl-ACP methyl ester carboxylesterase
VTIAKNLVNSFTVYLPDQRNHGQSPHSEIHDYDSMRDDLFELVSDLNLKKFTLAGHSMGGKTATSFALKWPEMLNGLLIADISPFSHEPAANDLYIQHTKILNTIISLDLRKISTRSEAEKILSDYISSEEVRGLILKNLQRMNDNTFRWKLNAKALLKNLDKIMESIDYKNDFSQQVTGFPVIFLKGGDSDYMTANAVRDIKIVFPAAEIIEIPGASHWIHVDRPDEVVINIKKLLT